MRGSMVSRVRLFVTTINMRYVGLFDHGNQVLSERDSVVKLENIRSNEYVMTGFVWKKYTLC